tara:strand:+ start:596 stop:1039 length:444 start_codon:yes stop_codon:yes gene_type:complete
MIKKNKVSITKISVQWGEMDAFNHVNNVMYIRWCETARISLFREIWGETGINMKEILDGNGVGPILANFNINYKLPLTYPDEVTIHTNVSQIGNTSFKLNQSLFSKKSEDTLVADATSIVVMVNYISGDKFILNQKIKSELEKFILH